MTGTLRARHASGGWHLPAEQGNFADMRGGWTYIMTNKPHGVLYTGVTAYLAQRIDQQRTGRGSAFCRKYGLNRLVLVEEHATIQEAIAREKALKAWKREWKIRLIEQVNPNWEDFFDLIA